MKYDAKCSDNQGNPLTTNDTGYQTYNNNAQNCTGNLSVVSTPNGYPIANIAETDAKTYCASLGGHLMTNDEWMTIAYNVVNQGSNWSGGSVGNGAVYIGHSDSSPNNALQASNDDTQGYFGTDGPASGGGTGSNATQKRTFSLSNGSIIWDFAGNVYQEVQRSNMNVGDNQTTMNQPACNNASSWTWCEFTSATAWSTDATTALTASQVSPPNNWISSKGMGQLLTWGPGGTGGGTNAFIRGGAWSGSTTDGPFALNLGFGTGGTHRAVGFRCVR
jgi:formylglycine-generating enzyme required for sulfatase activity